MTNDDEMMDAIHAFVDVHAKRGMFAFIDVLLVELVARERHLSTDELLSWLTATLPCKSKLKHRRGFLDLAKRIVADRGEKDIDELFNGS